jgi:tRNA(Ile)-lysidine synthetase-like protein
MALASLASEYLGANNVFGLIVDHQLNHYGVSEEPLEVQNNLAKMGIRSNILKLSWSNHLSGPVSLIPGKIMQESRDQRYRALFDACESENLSLLLTGHNLEDDIVTMFHRISRMSGIDGLAGMKLATTFPFTTNNSNCRYILRPFLTVPKKQLINTCISRGLSWNRDKSNDDLSFRRNECLHALIQLQSENSAIETKLLVQFLESFKKHRVYIHRKGNLNYYGIVFI